MSITKERKDQYTLLRVGFEVLNGSTAQDLKSEIVLENAEGRRNIILLANNITAADNKGLGAIVLGSTLCDDMKGLFVVAQPSSGLAECLREYDLDSKITVLPSLQEAVDAIFFHEIESELSGEEEEI